MRLAYFYIAFKAGHVSATGKNIKIDNSKILHENIFFSLPSVVITTNLYCVIQMIETGLGMCQ